MGIHPFGDGNGRTSRVIESFLLYKSGVNARGFYSLANYYYQNREEYVDTLDLVRFKSSPDVTPFIRFAVRGLVEELHQVHQEVIREVRMISFKDYARERLQSSGRLGSKTGIRQLLLLLELREQRVPVKDIWRTSIATWEVKP